jgi:putative protease
MGPCALCALPRLLQAGVESVKVVGREASLPRKVKSVEVAAMAMRIAKAGGTAGEIRQAVMALRGAEAMCQETHLCYYPDVWEQERLEESCDAG